MTIKLFGAAVVAALLVVDSFGLSDSSNTPTGNIILLA